MRAPVRKIAAVLCMLAFLVGGAFFCRADDYLLTEAYFAQPESVSGIVHVPGKGEMRYYAQNDALWGSLIYETGASVSSRPFRDSGCCPTALAMAVVNLLPEEKIPFIGQEAKTPFAICSCSVNKQRCLGGHVRYLITSQRDYIRFLPLIFGDYAAGNNRSGYLSRNNRVGTATGFIQGIADCYGLAYHFTADYQEMLEALRSGDKTVIALAGRGGAFTNTGHYVYLASADEEKLYILDPLCREVYNTKKGDKLTILQPGLISLLHRDRDAAQFSNFCIFEMK